MRVYLNQVQSEEDIPINFQKLMEVFENGSQYDLIVSPEVFLSGFRYQELESIAAENKNYINSICIQCKKHQTAFSGSFFWKEKNKFTNRAFFIDDEGGIAGIYDKNYLIPAFREPEYLSRGKKISIVKYKGLYIGLTICYDLRFPELYRKYAKKEADVIIVMAQWPSERRDHMLTLAKARAIENQCYIILVNATGKSGKIQMAGNSMVIHPTGEIPVKLGSGPEGGEGQIHLAEIMKWREEFPALFQYSRPRLFSSKPSMPQTDQNE